MNELYLLLRQSPLLLVSNHVCTAQFRWEESPSRGRLAMVIHMSSSLTKYYVE
jgi:hypothetical protein